jgi:hypothetical protein
MLAAFPAQAFLSSSMAMMLRIFRRAFTYPGQAFASLKHGAQYFLPKPYTAKTILRTLHQLSEADGEVS